jgi:hypothetical protein
MEEPKNEWPVGKQPDSVATPHHYFSVWDLGKSSRITRFISFVVNHSEHDNISELEVDEPKSFREPQQSKHAGKSDAGSSIFTLNSPKAGVIFYEI